MTVTESPTSARTPLQVAGVTLGATALVALADPTSNHVPLCVLKAATGLDCPFCGGLRAVHELSHLDVGAALGYNALVVFGIPVAVLLWFGWLRRSRAGLPARTWPKAVTWSLVALLVVFGIVRNLPFGAALGTG